MMKRTMTLVAVCALSALLALALSGCAQLGFGMKPGKPALKNATITAPALGQDGVLRVGVDSNNAPFATSVDDGRLVGIDVDIAAALAAEMGLKLELVDVGPEAEAALEAGTVDVIMGRDKSDTASACWLSDPYLESAVALWVTSTGVMMPTASSNPKIEAQESSMSAWEVTNQFGEEALVPVADLKTAFEDLNNGATELVAADIIIGSYVNHTSNGSKAQVLALMQTPGGYCIGVSNANNDLKTAVTNALRTIHDGGIIDVVLKKWLGTSYDLDSMAMTESAAKASGKPASSNGAEVSGVGSNAVEISGGSPDATIIEGDPAAGANYIEYTQEPVYTDTTTDYGTDQAADYTQNYVEPEANTYVEPTGDTGGEAVDTGYTEPAADYADGETGGDAGAEG